MKAEYKAVLASVVVIVLALSAVSGVTYSWFSDSEQTEIEINTATIDVTIGFENPSVTVTTTSEQATDTTASVSNGLMINNLVANRTIASNLVIINESTIPESNERDSPSLYMLITSV